MVLGFITASVYSAPQVKKHHLPNITLPVKATCLHMLSSCGPDPTGQKSLFVKIQLQSVIQNKLRFSSVVFLLSSFSFQTGNRIWCSHVYFYLVEPQLVAVVRTGTQIKHFILRDRSVVVNPRQYWKNIELNQSSAGRHEDKHRILIWSL